MATATSAILAEPGCYKHGWQALLFLVAARVMRLDPEVADWPSKLDLNVLNKLAACARPTENVA